MDFDDSWKLISITSTQNYTNTLVPITFRAIEQHRLRTHNQSKSVWYTILAGSLYEGLQQKYARYSSRQICYKKK